MIFADFISVKLKIVKYTSFTDIDNVRIASCIVNEYIKDLKVDIITNTEEN